MWINVAKSPLFGQNRLSKSAGWSPPDSEKNQKLSRRVKRMFMKYIKAIIRDYLSILGYQMDHFVRSLLLGQNGLRK